MISKTLIGTFLVFVLGAGAIVGGFQDQSKMQKNSTKFMQRKLDASRQIVEGLAIEDFDKISRAAQDLMLLSHEADWNVIQTQPYFGMSSEFRGAAERLRDSANDSNLDGATLAYFEVTLSCVRCHKYIRQKVHAPKKVK